MGDFPNFLSLGILFLGCFSLFDLKGFSGCGNLRLGVEEGFFSQLRVLFRVLGKFWDVFKTHVGVWYFGQGPQIFGGPLGILLRVLTREEFGEHILSAD